jgi:hypothetical protein
MAKCILFVRNKFCALGYILKFLLLVLNVELRTQIQGKRYMGSRL